MSWIEDILNKMNGENPRLGKVDVKKGIREAAIELMNTGFDWDDVEIFMVAKLRPLVGEYILLFHKWLREVRAEENEVTVQ